MCLVCSVCSRSQKKGDNRKACIKAGNVTFVVLLVNKLFLEEIHGMSSINLD